MFMLVMVQVLLGLSALHNAGMVHRDIKPLNIIYSERDQRLKLIDLGACADLRSGTNYTPDESILDPMYCPPEQVRAGHSLTTKLGIYVVTSLVIWCQQFVDTISQNRVIWCQKVSYSNYYYCCKFAVIVGIGMQSSLTWEDLAPVMWQV